MPDIHKNFAYSLVATAPSPAASGTSLVVTTGEGTLFPTPPFNAVVWATGSMPLSTNAEIVRVTAISTDTLTITRSQESTSARTIVVGDQIMAAVTAKTLTDIESAIAPEVITASPSADQNDYAPTGFDSGTTTLVLTPTTSVVLTGLSATGFAGGQRVQLRNDTPDSKVVVLADENASSTAANRFALSDSHHRGHYILFPTDSIELEYDSTDSRWKIVATVAGYLSRRWTHRFARAISDSGSISSMTSMTTTGTVSAVTLGDGSYYLEVPRVKVTTSTSAGASAGLRNGAGNHLIRGGAAGRGGFIVSTRFACDSNPANAGSVLIGVLNPGATDVGNIDASGFSSTMFAIGTDATQTTFRRLKNNFSTATATDLGANFPWNTTACYEFVIFAGPGTAGMSGVLWRTDDLTIAPVAWYETTNIPATTYKLAWQMHVGNRAAAAAYALSFMSLDIWQPN